MNDVENALTRKLGPFPAWIWALTLGGVIYWWRNRNAATTATSTTGQTVDSTAGLRDPVVLSPGESAYDPNSGQLVGASPAQTPPEPQPPVALDPGQAIYDPNTGQLLGEPPSASPTTPPGARRKPGKRGKVATTKHLQTELRHSHSPAHTRHIMDVLRSRGVKVRMPKKRKPQHTQGQTAHHTSSAHKQRPRKPAVVKSPTHTPGRPVRGGQSANGAGPRYLTPSEARTIKESLPAPAPRKVARPAPAPVIRQHAAPKTPARRHR